MVAANLDNTIGMQPLLKEHKILNELAKGVIAMKSYVFPSVLQKEAIPVIKAKGKSSNVIVRYSSMSGVKLTVLLPLINQMLREVAINPTGEPRAVVILGHSGMRCTELEGFLKDLLTFCKDVIEVVDLYNGDK